MPVALWFGTPSFTAFRLDPLYLTSLSFIGVIAVAMITFEALRAPFSLHLAHWVFVYIFFFTAPLIQYKVGMFPWRRLSSADTDTLLAINLALLLWCGTWIAARLVQERGVFRFSVPLGPRVSELSVLFTLVLALGATVYLISVLGGDALFVRAGYKETLNETFSTSGASLTMDKLLRGVTVAAAAGTLWLMSKRQVPLPVRLGMLVASLAVLFVANFPLGSGRYWFGAVYLGLALSVIGGRLKSGWPFVLLLVGGLLIVFPAVGDARDADSVPQAVSYVLEDSSREEPLATGDFDAYAMVGYTYEYMSEGSGITYGQQLLGPLLFFVPNEVWPGKPSGSGWTVALERNLSFDNVSSSPLAEGMINFGWIGVPIFALAFSLLFAAIDASYKRARSEAKNSLLCFLYPFWIGFSLLLLRGDLLSSTAFIVGFTVAFLPLVAFPIKLMRSRPGKRYNAAVSTGRHRSYAKRAS